MSPVNLTLTSSSSDSCNLTVTCTIVDLNISRTFRCDAHNCSLLEENPSTTDMLSSLIVYLQQDTVFCNHSNEVSWNNSTMVLKSQCDTKSGKIRCQRNNEWKFKRYPFKDVMQQNFSEIQTLKIKIFEDWVFYSSKKKKKPCHKYLLLLFFVLIITTT